MSGGHFKALCPPWLELDLLENYDLVNDWPQHGEQYEDGWSPLELLIAFIQNYLKEDRTNVVICENWGWRREHIPRLVFPPPRIACFGDNEIYHLLTPDISGHEEIDAAVRDRHHWQTGICTTCERVPEGDIPNEQLLDEFVENTVHVFIPAFDATGYLIWTREGKGDGGSASKSRK